jgi:hypothetical protein
LFTSSSPDADTFTIEYPPGIDANMKAVLLGSTFFLNAMIFETQKDTKKPEL